MSRMERRNAKKLSKVEKSITYSIISIYISVILYFFNTNFAFLVYLSLIYSGISVVRDFRVSDKSKRLFF